MLYKENTMSNVQKKINHLAVLEQRHSTIEKEIDALHNAFSSDAEVHSLKVKKLHLKEEIEQIKSSLPK